MLSVDPFDKYLDPPELPTHGPCDGCGETYENGDLTHIKRPGVDLWMCDECCRTRCHGCGYVMEWVSATSKACPNSMCPGFGVEVDIEQEGDDGNES